MSDINSTLPSLVSPTFSLMMSSISIAELTGKRHSHVLRDIRNMLEELKKGDPNLDSPDFKRVSVGLNDAGQTREIRLDKHLTLTLTSGYSVSQRYAIVTRWLELEESQKTTPLAADTPATLALRDMQAGLKIAKLLGCPESYAIQIASQHAERLTGYPVTMLANSAAACQDVPEGDVMLEPAELGKLLDMSAIAMNKSLESLGLQSKVGGVWVATSEGAKLSTRHAWTRRGKSGYNLKWNASAIGGMICRNDMS